ETDSTQRAQRVEKRIGRRGEIGLMPQKRQQGCRTPKKTLARWQAGHIAKMRIRGGACTIRPAESMEISLKIWHPFTNSALDPEPIFVERAEGVWLHTRDGRKILDAVSSWWVNLHGHGNPQIAAAIAEQARKMEHVILAG